MNGGCLSRHRVGALTESTDRKHNDYNYGGLLDDKHYVKCNTQYKL